jgi:hypothetical protein
VLPLLGRGPASDCVGLLDEQRGLAASAQAFDPCRDLASKSSLLCKKRMRPNLTCRTRDGHTLRLDDRVKLIQAALGGDQIVEEKPLGLSKRSAFSDELALDVHPSVWLLLRLHEHSVTVALDAALEKNASGNPAEPARVGTQLPPGSFVRR